MGLMALMAISFHDFTCAFDSSKFRRAEPLRLKGGWARGETKQRVIRVPDGRLAISNHPKAISKRPCSGPKALTKLERLHGIDVVRGALYTASPMSKFFDPRTAVLRMGLRMDRWDTNQELRLNPVNDTNMLLLKAAYFGVKEIIKPLVDSGADVNFIGKAVSSTCIQLFNLPTFV
jgi:hypothetical protein